MKTSSLTNTSQTLSSNQAKRGLSKKVFVFDTAGKLHSTHPSISECARALNIGRPSVLAGQQRGSLVASRYYITYQENFKLANFNQKQNPLRPRSQNPKGDKNRAGYLATEFYDILY